MHKQLPFRNTLRAILHLVLHQVTAVSLNMVQKTFIGPSIIVHKPPNASLAVTHKSYCTISHASYNKRRKISESMFASSVGFDLRSRLFSSGDLQDSHAVVIINSPFWIKTVSQFQATARSHRKPESTARNL